MFNLLSIFKKAANPVQIPVVKELSLQAQLEQYTVNAFETSLANVGDSFYVYYAYITEDSLIRLEIAVVNDILVFAIGDEFTIGYLETYSMQEAMDYFYTQAWALLA